MAFGAQRSGGHETGRSLQSRSRRWQRRPPASDFPPRPHQSAELRAQRRIVAAIAAGTELHTVLASITRATARLCRSPMAAITLLTDRGEELHIAGVCGTDTPIVETRLPVAASLSGVALTSRRSIRSTDALRDRRSLVREMARRSGARGLLVVPLSGPQGRFGSLVVAKRTPWRFPDRDAARLTQLADDASIAIQNAQLRERLVMSTLPVPEPAPGLKGPIRMRPQPVNGNTEQPATCEPEEAPLGPRQREVLKLIVAGNTYREVATTLGISARTVEHHVERLKLRFDQPRLRGLVSYAIRHAL